jgi:hypothetical protein
MRMKLRWKPLSRRARGPAAGEARVKRGFSAGMLLGGIAVLAYGVAQCYRYPAGMYRNYWGGGVYAPFVAAVGALLMIFSPFKLDPGVSSAAFPHHELRGVVHRGLRARLTRLR